MPYTVSTDFSAEDPRALAKLVDVAADNRGRCLSYSHEGPAGGNPTASFSLPDAAAARNFVSYLSARGLDAGLTPEDAAELGLKSTYVFRVS